MELPGWYSIHSVVEIHAWLEGLSVLFFVALVVFDVLAHLVKKRETLLTRIALSCFAIAVLAEVCAYPYSRRIDTLSSEAGRVAAENIAQLNKEAGNARMMAGKAIEHAAVLEKETVVLRRQILTQERRGNLLNEPKRQAAFVAHLKPFPRQRFDIRYCRNPDTEISFFSLTLMGHLSGALWDMGDFSPSLGCSVGMMLMLHPRASASTKAAATALLEALFEVGLVRTAKPQWLLAVDRPAAFGETILVPSTVDTILIAVDSHP